MYNIVASKLINDLILNTDISSQLIVTEIMKSKELMGQRKLLIAIDSDDDFAVDGTSLFSKSFDLGDRDIVEVYRAAIESINFGHHNQKNYKLDDFLSYITSADFLLEVSTGDASGGGNQTIDVSIINAPTIFQIGSLTVDLSK